MPWKIKACHGSALGLLTCSAGFIEFMTHPGHSFSVLLLRLIFITQNGFSSLNLHFLKFIGIWYNSYPDTDSTRSYLQPPKLYVQKGKEKWFLSPWTSTWAQSGRSHEYQESKGSLTVERAQLGHVQDNSAKGIWGDSYPFLWTVLLMQSVETLRVSYKCFASGVCLRTMSRFKSPRPPVSSKRTIYEQEDLYLFPETWAWGNPYLEVSSLSPGSVQCLKSIHFCRARSHLQAEADFILPWFCLHSHTLVWVEIRMSKTSEDASGSSATVLLPYARTGFRKMQKQPFVTLRSQERS